MSKNPGVDQNPESLMTFMKMQGQEELLEQLMDMYPDLRNDKDEIYTKCIKKKEEEKKEEDDDETVVTEIEYGGKKYYIDSNTKSVYNENIQLVGVFRKYDENNEPELELFDRKKPDFGNIQLVDL